MNTLHAPARDLVEAAVSSGEKSSTRRGTHRAAALIACCGILSPAIYVAADVIAARRYPGYSYADQAVSELFAIGAPTSAFVVVCFTISSALLLCFAIGAWWLAAGRRRVHLLAITLAASAINSLVLWTAFPMHMRGAAPTLTDTMHLILAANPFWLLSLIFGAAAFRDGFRVYSIATIVLLVALAIYGFSYAPAVMTNGPTPWMGLAERVAQYGHGLWTAVLALVLWRASKARVEKSTKPSSSPGLE